MSGTGLLQKPYDPPLLRTLRHRLEDDCISNKEKSCEEWHPIPYRIILLKEINEIISRETMEKSIDNGDAYRIMMDGRPVGGVIISIDGEKGDLDILFTSPKIHSKGVGYAAWCEIEKLHPEIKVWETVTPYLEQRNIHFYVNRVI